MAARAGACFGHVGGVRVRLSTTSVPDACNRPSPCVWLTASARLLSSSGPPAAHEYIGDQAMALISGTVAQLTIAFVGAAGTAEKVAR